ncbi:MAG: hypothetical protein Kow0062_11460 [Acidobacteriota bacterium]
MNPGVLAVRRPVGVAMLFAGLTLLGAIGLVLMPVELFPRLVGDTLWISFSRPGSDPELVERELLIPLEGRLATLGGVSETEATITGSGGTLRVRFEAGVDLDARELELRQLAAELQREQPFGTVVEVFSFDFDALSRFVMLVEITGDVPREALDDLVEERVSRPLSAVAGVSRVITAGSTPAEVRVTFDADRGAAWGVRPADLVAALAAALERPASAGRVERGIGRMSVVVDGRPAGPVSLARLRVAPDRPVTVGQVAVVERTPGRRENAYRIGGRPAVSAIVFKDEQENLVAVCRRLRARIAELDRELAPLGLSVGIGFDGGHEIERQIARLARLALAGFAVALLVLLAFLRDGRAVAVVGLAVPASLLIALGLIHLGGASLNVITLFALAVGLGMLVDNGIVVYEAVQRRLERGVEAARSVTAAVAVTARAIVAASATNAIVFAPLLLLDLDNTVLEGILRVIALAIVTPLVASLLVALGLVPLLAHRLAVPAAVRRLAAMRRERLAFAGLPPPDRLREVFAALLASTLRRPFPMIAATLAAVGATLVIGLPLLAMNALQAEPTRAREIRVDVAFERERDLPAAEALFDRIEAEIPDDPAIEKVTSYVESQGGWIQVRFADDARAADQRLAGRVRRTLERAARETPGVLVRRAEEGPGQDALVAEALGQGLSRVVVSGPESRRLELLAREIEARLVQIDGVGRVYLETGAARDQLLATPLEARLLGLGLTPDQVLPALAALRREGTRLAGGLPDARGREIPVVVVREDAEHATVQALERTAIDLGAARVRIGELFSFRRAAAPPQIRHRNGRREIEVRWGFAPDAPRRGPARAALERRVADELASVHRPAGYVIDPEPPGGSSRWFRRAFVPVVLLLFVVLAATFESVLLPLLVLLALPLTMIGAVWGLVVTGEGASPMALVGAVALMGVTVNPAILLVDRMRSHADAGLGLGASALAAVRERARPVLMTSATTVAGLWPLALATGRENEIWPPFAIVMIGGLVASTGLTLLVIPASFVLLGRIEQALARLGGRWTLAWMATSVAILAPLFAAGLITSLLWQVLVTVLVAGGLLALTITVLAPPRRPDPLEHGVPPRIEIRSLRKVYGEPGALRRAWRSPEEFAERVAARGGEDFAAWRARRRALPLVVGAAATGWAGWATPGLLLPGILLLVAAALAGILVADVPRLLRGPRWMRRITLLRWALPWGALGLLLVRVLGRSSRADGIALLVLASVGLAGVQVGRALALHADRRRAAGRPAGRLARTVGRLFAFDLPTEEVLALDRVDLTVDGGMVGVLGPNGAGKTTLLRCLAGVLVPSRGALRIGGVPLGAVRTVLGRYVGYLPQEFGLPGGMTVREYLDYWGLLYELDDGAARRARVADLIREVGLEERADARIAELSGGMRQRVAVARTLLRLPPVIIVDEPTVGLDPRERVRFRNLLARLARGRLVLFSTHVVEDVAVACERVIVLAGGRLVYDGPVPGLADLARGRVYVLRAAEGEAPQAIAGAIEAGRRVVEGGVEIRLLAAERPHPDAVPDEPTLEDGYLWLTAGREFR